MLTGPELQSSHEWVRSISHVIDIELEYLKTQRLGRLATMNKHGAPQIAPVTFLSSLDIVMLFITIGS